MPAGVTYDVNAFLKTQGSFQKEMSGAARGADRLGRSYGSMSDRMISAGERVRGNFVATGRELARGAILAGAAGLAGGIAMAAREGVKFNDMMEQGALGLGTMYTTFGLTVNSAEVLTGEMTEFAKATELAKSMQKELFDIAKKSPATFEDMATAYQAMAPGVSGVTGDLIRQRDLMKKIAVLGFTTGGDFKQLGMDVGRIVTGVAGADVAVFRTLGPNIKKSFREFEAHRMVAENKAKDLEGAYEKVDKVLAKGDFAAHFNKIAKADGEAALTIFENALAGISEEINAAFGASFGGVMATAASELQVLGGAFGKPLMESMTKAALGATGEGGVFEGAGLEGAARFAGGQLARAADYLFGRLISGAEYISANWATIATKIQEAGVLAGVALKAASAVATARLVAGYGMIAVGKGAQAAQALGGAGRAVGGGMRKRARGLHMGIGRGMAGQKGGGMAGGMGRGLGKVFGKLDSKSVLGIFKGFDKGLLKVATMGTMIVAAGAAASVLAIALSGVMVIAGSLAAYVISNWSEIKTSLIQGFEDGKITLVPLITSMYTLWERAKLTGEALFGVTDATSIMAGGIGMMTGAIDFMSTVLGATIGAISIMVGAWGALKLGMMGVMKVILAVAELGAKIGAVDEKTITRARSNYAKYAAGVDDTFTRADQLARAGEAISNATLDPMKLKAAEDRAKSLEEALGDMLSGDGKDGKDGDGRNGKKSTINQKIVINTTDPDVDRLMAGFINYAERQSDKRVQAYEGPTEQGN